MKVVTVFFSFLFFSVVLQAGVYMEESVKTPSGKIIKQSRTWIDDGLLRVDVDMPRGHHTMIYRVKEQKIFIINRGEKKFFVMDRGAIAAAQLMFRQQKARLDKIMVADKAAQKQRCAEAKKKQAALPIAKRSSMNSAVADACVPAHPGYSDIIWKKGGVKKSGKWKCQVWNGMLGSKKVSESCTISTAVVGVVPDDFKIFKTIDEQFSMMDNADKNNFMNDLKSRGVPVEVVTYENGQPVAITYISVIKKEPVSPAVFMPPKGLREEKNPMKQVIPHD